MCAVSRCARENIGVHFESQRDTEKPNMCFDSELLLSVYCATLCWYLYNENKPYMNCNCNQSIPEYTLHILLRTENNAQIETSLCLVLAKMCASIATQVHFMYTKKMDSM